MRQLFAEFILWIVFHFDIGRRCFRVLFIFDGVGGPVGLLRGGWNVFFFKVSRSQFINLK